MDALLHDLRYALRTLAKSPGFTLVAVATLALGIGGTTVIFTLIDAVLLRPPAHVREPDRLVSIYTSDYSGPRYSASSLPDVQDFRDRAEVLSSVAAYTPRPVSFTAGDEPTRALAELVSGEYFAVLGMVPAAGRLFRPDEGRTPGADPVVVLSYSLWQQHFGGDPAVVGKTIRLTGHPFTVVGVAPPDFSGLVRGLDVGLWVPLSMQPVLQPGSNDLTERGSRGWFVVGRLKPGATLEQARARFAVIGRQLHDAFPDQWTDVHDSARVVSVLPEREARVFPRIRGALIGFMSILMVVAVLVLLICCANLANLLLARATRRRREVAIRLAIGAARGRLVRQLLTESAVLAIAGALAGALVAGWAAGLLSAFQPPVPVPVALDLRLDLRVLSFTLLVAVGAAVAFGLLPALRATRPDLVGALKQEQSAASGHPRWFGLRDLLVVGQVAISLVLLVAAGLLLRSLRNAQQMDLGFDPHGLAFATVAPSLQGYPEARATQLYATLTQRLATTPGVEAVATAKLLPLGLDFERRSVRVVGYQPRPGEDMEFGDDLVGPGYFAAMRISIVRGRAFTDRDRAGAPRVVIVNQTFVRRFWPGQDPIGKRLEDGFGYGLDVVGVAHDGKYRSLGEESQPFFYLCALQPPISNRAQTDLTVIVRTAGDPSALLPVLRQEIHALDRDLPVQLATMDQHLGLVLLPQRMGATLLGGFGVLGLALAALGLYGVMAYAVSLRTREIGIRMALGARAADVRRMVVTRGLAVTGVGVVLGLLVAFLATRLVTSVLFGVSPTDPVTFAGVVLILAAAGALAAYVPARRATRVDPVVALRTE
jgi:putative ABC transport system permease protein